MTEETEPVRPRGRRLRWGLWGAAALIVVAGSAGTGLALTSSPASRPPLSRAPANHTTPTNTVTPSATGTPSGPRPTAYPSRTASHPAPPQTPAPAQGQPTTVPQQDCYAPPHPTCTPPPPPSSLLTSPYIPNPPNPTPKPSYTISEAP